MNMGMFSMRLTVEEEKALYDYAKLQNKSKAQVVKEALLEKLEDEYDYRIGVEAYNEYLKDKKTYTSKEINKMLGL